MVTRKVWFATNRGYDEQDGQLVFNDLPHPEGARFFRVGSASLKKRTDNSFKLKSYEVLPETAPEERGQDGTPGSAKMFHDLGAELVSNGGAELLIFIHGYGNSFEGPLERAAELAHKFSFKRGQLGVDLIALAFCWPSNGSIWGQYGKDRDDARDAGPAMTRSLIKLIKFLNEMPESQRCDRPIHLVAHSMGNFALRHMLLALRNELKGAPWPRVFRHVFLMAADEDFDALEEPDKLAPLIDISRSVTVYYSDGDEALDVSDITKGNPERLGSVGPRTMDGLSSKIRAVDCSAIDETRGKIDGDHQYYHLRKEIIYDVQQVLAGQRHDLIKHRTILQPGRRYFLANRS